MRDECPPQLVYCTTYSHHQRILPESPKQSKTESIDTGEIRSGRQSRIEKERSDQDDLRLLEGIAMGEHDYLSTIYDKYQKLIYSLVLRIVRNEAEAADLVQETFFQVWEKASLFDNERGSFATWLVTLAHNKGINTLRSKRYKKSKLEITHDIAELTEIVQRSTVSDPTTPLDSVIQQDERRVVLAALGEIPEAQRKALYLSYYEGYSQTEIAEILRVPLGTVKTRMRQGMLKLQELLGKE